MKLKNINLPFVLICITLIMGIILIVALAPPTTYDIEAEVLYYIGDEVYCVDTNGNVWAFTTEGYILQEGEHIVLSIYAGDMDYLQDDKVLAVKYIVEQGKPYSFCFRRVAAGCGDPNWLKTGASAKLIAILL